MHEFHFLFENQFYPLIMLVTFIGLIFFPFQNEVVIGLSGLITKATGMHYLISFFIVFTLSVFVISHLTYFTGRGISQILPRPNMNRGPRIRRKILFHHEKFAQFALVFCYFIPIVRFLVPLLLGIQKISYRSYFLYTYVGAVLWTSTYYFPFFIVEDITLKQLNFWGNLLILVALIAFGIKLYQIIGKLKNVTLLSK